MSITDALQQYGIAGLVVVIMLPFLGKLINDRFKKADERGDRLEAELREVNRFNQERLIGELTRLAAELNAKRD